MGSDSNIYNMKLTQQNISQENALKSHNSESAINIMSHDKYLGSQDEVHFRLGDDEERLVRLSSNNDDEDTCSSCHDDNVKRICSEIKDYCSVKVQEGFDIVNNMDGIKEYMVRRASEIDACVKCEKERDGMCDFECANKVSEYIARRASEIDVCAKCEKERDGMCDLECANKVTDVIVLPSAEAILDIGANFENGNNEDSG